MLNVIPAGRVLFGAGSGTQVTYFNCFVMPFVADSRGGIAEHRKEVMEIMSRGGRRRHQWVHFASEACSGQGASGDAAAVLSVG